MNNLIGNLTARCVRAALMVLVLVCCNMTAALAFADVFHIGLPQLARAYPYEGSLSPIEPINLGTQLADLTSIQLQLSGTHTDGLVYNNQLQTYFPELGDLHAVMGSTLLTASQWVADYEGDGNGTFSITMTLGGSDWSFLQNGITDISLGSSGIFYPPFDELVSQPYFSVTSATLVINATPVPEPSAVVLTGVGAIGLVVYALRRRTRYC